MAFPAQDPSQIDTSAPVQAAQDYLALRSLGIQLISQLGTDIWTDFNVHDPGITILETLVYAITDLGFRSAFPVSDMLAAASTATLAQEEFHTAANVLPSSPVTVQDLRKLLIDQDGVSNAWITEGNPFVGTKGLRRITIQPTDAQLSAKAREQLRHDIASVFWAHRNLGETLESVTLMEPEPIVLQLQLIVSTQADPTTVLAAALIAIDDLLQGVTRFLTLPEMTAQMGGDMASVFEGPLLRHGFIPDANLHAATQTVDPDALIKAIVGIEGLESVVRLEIVPQFVSQRAGSGQVLQQLQPDGSLQLQAGYYPLLNPNLAAQELLVIQGRMPYAIDLNALSNQIIWLKSTQAAPKNAPQAIDLPIPTGKFRDLAHYYTVQYDFPAIYNLGPNPGILSASPQVAQMRGYLLLFDQVLANYLSQLANLGQLFSWDADVQRTYFFQGLEAALHDLAQMLVGTPVLGSAPPTSQQADALRAGLAAYYTQLGALRENRTEFLARRTLFLDHLLARLGRSLEAYVHRLPKGDPEKNPQHYINAAQRFLAEYPTLSSRRGAGSNPLVLDGRPTSESGLHQVIAAILHLPTQDVLGGKLYNQVFIQNGRPQRARGLSDQYIIQTDDGSPIRMDHLMALAVEPVNYRLVQVQRQPGLFGLALIPSVLQGEVGESFQFINTFIDTATAEAAIVACVKRFQAYSLAAERVYLIDHSLLRPSALAPVHGLALLDENKCPFLETVSWFPVPALMAVQELDSTNSTIQYQGESWSASSPPASGMGSPPAYGAASPPSGDARFVFSLYALQNGQPFPVFPSEGVPLPGDFAPSGPTMTSLYASRAILAYLQGFYGSLLSQPLELGQQLSNDFQAKTLPADWVSSGKSGILQTLGQYGLYSILQGWQADYAPYPSLDSALQRTLASVSTQAGSPQAPPLAAERALLLGFIRLNYSADQCAAPDFASRLQTDLGTASPSDSTFALQARAYLSCAGRALGASFLGGYFPGLALENLGEGILYATGMQDPVALGPTLEEIVGNYLFRSLVSQPHTDDPKGTLDKLMQGKQPGDDELDPSTLKQAGWELWKTWIASRAAGSNGSLSHQRALLGVYLATNAQSPLAAGNADSLSALVGAQISTQYGFPPPPTPGFNAAGLTSSTLHLTDIPSVTAPASLEKTLPAAMMQACTWYIQHILSQPGGGGQQGAAIRQSLGLDSTAQPESLWKLGDQALHHYLQVHFPNGLPDAATIGSKLQQLFQGNSGQDPALPGIGAFHLTDFLHNALSQAQSTSQSGADYLHGLLSHAFAQKPAPTANGGTSLVGGLLDGWLHRLTHPDTPAGGQAGTAANGVSALTDTGHALGAINLADFIGKLLPPPWNSAAQLLQHLGLFQHPVNLSALPADIVNGLRDAGHTFMHTYMASRFRWQLSHALTLGQAAKSLLPSGGAAARVFPAFAPPAPVQYGVTLSYRAADLPVYMEATRLLPSQDEAVQQIQSLQQRIPQYKAGTLPFQDVFHTLTYLPPPLDTRPDLALTWQDLYACRVTILIPDWPTRFQEAGFRDQVVQLIEEECPAHIRPHCLWLSKQAMQRFEPNYNAWIAMDLADAGRQALSQSLMAFILETALAQTASAAIRPANG